MTDRTTKPQTPPVRHTRRRQSSSQKQREWFAKKYFAVGVLLTITALFMLIPVFNIRNLSSDQREVLHWLLPLVSGFAAGAFVGSVTVTSKGLLPGMVTTAVGGFAVWLICHFTVFTRDGTRVVALQMERNGVMDVTCKFTLTAWSENMQPTTQVGVGQVRITVPSADEDIYVDVDAGDYYFQSTKPLSTKGGIVHIPLERSPLSAELHAQLLKSMDEGVYRQMSHLTHVFSLGEREQSLRAYDKFMREINDLINALTRILDNPLSEEDQYEALHGVAVCRALELHARFRFGERGASLQEAEEQILEACKILDHRKSLDRIGLRDLVLDEGVTWRIAFSKCTALASRVIRNAGEREVQIAALNALKFKFQATWNFQGASDLELFKQFLTVSA